MNEAETKAAADLKNILVLQIQSHLTEHGQFEESLSQLAGQ